MAPRGAHEGKPGPPMPAGLGNSSSPGASAEADERLEDAASTRLGERNHLNRMQMGRAVGLYAVDLPRG